MATARLSGASRGLRSNTYRPSTAIAMYHGVTRKPLEVDEWCFVDEARFSAQMTYLADHFSVVHVEQAAHAVESPRPVAAVTFDDGFASVFDIAWPILRALGIPATVYAVTDLIDSDQTVWFAKVHHALSTTRRSRVEIAGTTYNLDSAAARAAASRQVQLCIKSHGPEHFEQQLAHVLDQLDVLVDPTSVDHLRMLTSEQIHEMSEDGLVRFGGHTTSHQILSRVPVERAATEIRRSVEDIDRIAGRRSTSFAYPNGGEGDFDQSAVDVLQQIGIAVAVTTSPGPNWPDTDPYRLRRYGIASRDSLNEFAWKMHHTRDKLRPRWT